MADAEGLPKYFVQGDDGAQYGPATIDELKRWVAEQRVRPETILVDATTNQSTPAREFPELFGATDAAGGPPPIQSPPPPFANPVYAAAPKRGMSAAVLIAVVIVGVCGFGTVILAAILLPVFASARAAAQKAAAVSHMKELAIGVEIYASDYDDKFPRDMSSAKALQPVLLKYTKDPLPFKSINPDGGEILGNGKLSGQNIGDVLRPIETVMLYDSKAWHGKALIGYTDAHTNMKLDFSALAEALKRDPFKDDGDTTSAK